MTDRWNVRTRGVRRDGAEGCGKKLSMRGIGSEAGLSVVIMICQDLLLNWFFFFQAEDGIRDTSVTGVQTCALPIFEGEIPKGNYGAGTVEIWDRGTYELVEEKKDGGLTVRLHGKRLEGLWTLVPAKLDGDPKNWLIIRKRENGAAPAEGQPRRYQTMLATLTSPDELPIG